MPQGKGGCYRIYTLLSGRLNTFQVVWTVSEKSCWYVIIGFIFHYSFVGSAITLGGRKILQVLSSDMALPFYVQYSLEKGDKQISKRNKNNAPCSLR